MEEKKPIEVPTITTYDREELDLELAITGEIVAGSEGSQG